MRKSAGRGVMAGPLSLLDLEHAGAVRRDAEVREHERELKVVGARVSAITRTVHSEALWEVRVVALTLAESGPNIGWVPARAGNRCFWWLRALRARTKAPHNNDLHRKTSMARNRPPGGPDRGSRRAAGGA